MVMNAKALMYITQETRILKWLLLKGIFTKKVENPKSLINLQHSKKKKKTSFSLQFSTFLN